MPTSDVPDPQAAAELAEATRRVIDVVRRCHADGAAMREAKAQLEAVAERLAPHTHGGPFMQRGLAFEGWMGENPEPPDDFAAFFPYSPLIGPRNPLAPPIAFEVREGRIHGRVRFGAAHNGPPQCVHGGVIAAAFDELLGSTNLANGVGGMTGTLSVRYREPTPLHREIALEGWLDRVEGRKVFTCGEMREGGRVTAEATGIFITGSMERLRLVLEPAR